MYRLSVIFLVLLLGCQQEMPPSATALTDAEKTALKQEVDAAYEDFISMVESVDINAARVVGVESQISFLDGAGAAFWNSADMLENVERSWELRESQTIEISRSETIVLSANSALTVSLYQGSSTSKEGEISDLREGKTTIVWVKTDRTRTPN